MILTSAPAATQPKHARLCQHLAPELRSKARELSQVTHRLLRREPIQHQSTRNAMQINLNHTVISGTLNGPPTLTTLRSGEVTCVMRLACTCTGGTRRRASGTTCFGVRTFGAHARAVSRYLRYGRSVAIQGHLSYHHEPDQDKRFEIVANQIQFLDQTTSKSTNPSTRQKEEIIDEDNINHRQSSPEMLAAGIVG